MLRNETDLRVSNAKKKHPLRLVMLRNALVTLRKNLGLLRNSDLPNLLTINTLKDFKTAPHYNQNSYL